MTAVSRLDQVSDAFEPLADALRSAVLDEYDRSGQKLTGVAGLRTLETNSGLAASRANTLLALLAAHAPDFDLTGRKVLDLGCGFGALSVYLGYLGAEVTAVDIRPQRLVIGQQVAREFGLTVHWIEAPLQELPLPDRSVDLVVINNSLCYVVPRPDRLVSLVHVRRVLRPGGWLLMRNPSRTAPRDPFTGLPLLNRLPPAAAQLAAHTLRRHRSHVRLLSARAQRAELRRVGFEVVAITAAAARTVAPLDRWLATYQHVLARRPAA